MSDDLLAPVSGDAAAPGTDAAAATPIAAPTPAVALEPKTGAKPTFKETFDAIRQTIAARKADAPTGAPQSGESAPPAVEGEGEGEGGASDDPLAGGGETDEELVVDLGARREGEDPLLIQAPDKATADAIRALRNRAMTTEQVTAARDDAESRYAAAEDLRYIAEMDPAGFLIQNVEEPRDLAYTVQRLMTQPGVFPLIEEWVREMAENPSLIATEARLIEADGVKRERAIQDRVSAKRAEDKSASACRGATIKSINSLVPQEWSEREREALYQDVWNDLRTKVQTENLRVVDPRTMAGMVQARLARYGISARRSSAPTGDATRPTPALPTPDSLRIATEQRRRATGAGPGAGSPVVGLQKLPAGTMLTRTKDADGNVKPSAFDLIRPMLRTLRRSSP